MAASGDVFWALTRAAGYLVGKGVTFGGPLLQPAAVQPNVYSIPIGPVRTNGIAGLDPTLDIFAERSLDHILLTPMVESLQVGQWESLLRQVGGRLKIGGHLVVLVNIGNPTPGALQLYPDEVKESVGNVGRWRMKIEHTEGERYLLIAKRVGGKRGWEVAPVPSGRKRVCIARYGAIGDAIIMTPLIRRLAQEGYEVTLNISTYCADVFQGNPHVSNVIIQERELIPNALLGKYWNFWETQYDLYINLSESIEGDLLMVEGRGPFFTSKAWREEKCNRNYTLHTLRRGGFESGDPLPELFFTRAEERRAEKFWAPLQSTFNLLWALNGSSHHKVYPMFEATLREWFTIHPDSRCVTVGDYTAKLLEFEHPQLIERSGVWTLRESLIGTKYADCVVGPETAMLNAAGCFPTPKIPLLSHSTHENLCQFWENDYCLAPDSTIAPCYPCHQLHYTRESCPVGEMRDTTTGEVLGQSPICTLAVTPERLLNRLEEVYQRWKSH